MLLKTRGMHRLMPSAGSELQAALRTALAAEEEEILRE
jgi:hypothetical protein